eukprot:TRINITY_DN3906_c0_g1_i1.p1 TRINITY_DN3906_c0_g1~~TRINITY_DN3906_c0_g1_i1.p1  ORF type:complete len:415 (+),score=91.26 TRINITY_DN3906_c0_g1_i1:154-1398(+)
MEGGNEDLDIEDWEVIEHKDALTEAEELEQYESSIQASQSQAPGINPTNLASSIPIWTKSVGNFVNNLVDDVSKKLTHPDQSLKPGSIIISPVSGSNDDDHLDYIHAPAPPQEKPAQVNQVGKFFNNVVSNVKENAPKNIRKVESFFNNVITNISKSVQPQHDSDKIPSYSNRYTTNKQPSDPVFWKILVVGDDESGKSSIIQQLVTGRFVNEHKPTSGFSSVTNLLKLDSSMTENPFCLLEIWDLPGNKENYNKISVPIWHSSEIVIFVIDLTNPDALHHLEKWIIELKEKCLKRNEEGLIITSSDDPLFVVFGNKIDLVDDRKISHDVALEWCASNSLTYVETTATSHESVADAFGVIAKLNFSRHHHTSTEQNVSDPNNDDDNINLEVEYKHDDEDSLEEKDDEEIPNFEN